jgi:hypothetical protein
VSKGWRKHDLVGQVFGMLTVEGLAGQDKWSQTMWSCRCACGKEERSVVRQGHLLRGMTLSCGCLRESSLTNQTHGGSGTWEYRKWRNAKKYGGLVAAWRRDFAAFRDAIPPRPRKPGVVLARVNSRKPWGPGNMHWTTKSVVMSTGRYAHLITLNGRRQTLKAWATEYGIYQTTIQTRLRLGWSAREAITTPAAKPKNRK